MSSIPTLGTVPSFQRGIGPKHQDPIIGLGFSLRLQSHRRGFVMGINATDGGANAAWSDLLSGSGLSATQATGASQPLTRYESGIPYLEFDGVDDKLISTLAASTLASAGTYACLFRNRTQYNTAGLLSGGSSSPLLSSTGGSFWGMGKPGAYAPVGGVAMPDLEWGVFVATWNGTAYNYYVRTIAGIVTPTSGTLPSAFTSAAGNIGVGVHNTVTPFSHSKVDMIAALVSPTALSAGNAATLRDYLWTIRPGGVPPMSRKVVGLGDSLTAGFTIGVDNVWLSRLTSAPSNFGNSGWTVHQMESLVASVIAQGGPEVDFVLEGGMNNTTHYGGVYTPAQTWAKMQQIFAAVRPYFRKVICVTLTPQSLVTTNPNYETDRQTLNALMRAGVEVDCDAVADLGASSSIMGEAGDNTNALYFFDGLHYTCRGQLVLRDLILAALR